MVSARWRELSREPLSPSASAEGRSSHKARLARAQNISGWEPFENAQQLEPKNRAFRLTANFIVRFGRQSRSVDQFGSCPLIGSEASVEQNTQFTPTATVAMPPVLLSRLSRLLEQ